MSTGIFLSWWLLASALIWLTWNRVIGTVAKVKTIKFWQAIIFVSTLCVFWFPRVYMARAIHCGAQKHHAMHCCRTKPCDHHEAGDTSPKGDCPYAKQNTHHE